MPATLSYYGTIGATEGVPFPAANYLTTNPINDGAFIWVPVGSKIMYANTSDADATGYKWTVPGADDFDATAKNATVTYSVAGVYDFPTLQTTYASGMSEFKHELKIKVGGRAEICHSDTRKWGETWAVGHAPFGPGNGYLGGSNKVNIAGVGNFYRFSSPDMFVDGVNIYAAMEPEGYDANARVKVRVYLPYITDSSFSMMGMFGSIGAIDAADIPMRNYRTHADGAYVPGSGNCVYSMNMADPLRCEGYPYLFFAVEGFAYDPQAAQLSEKFVLAADVMPGRVLSSAEYNNAMAHNSFVRGNGESDYLRPVSVYGGSAPANGGFKSYSFWICPIVRGAETPLGVNNIAMDVDNTKLTVERQGDLILVSGVADDIDVAVYSMSGTCVAKARAANGGVIFNTASLGRGVYLVSAANGASAKFVK